MKNVLIVGGGGREHAIAWKLSQSSTPIQLFVAPGNAGTALVAENRPIKATDIESLLSFAQTMHIDLTVVGQDDPLALGIVDAFQEAGLRIFGPSKGAALIESSKVFSKTLMQTVGVPTAPFHIYGNEPEAVSAYVRRHFDESTVPIVLKASGLALGKGAYVCRTLADADAAINELLVERVHGDAGNLIVIEKFVDGPEVSIHAFCDGTVFKLFPSAQDHKPIFDDDWGPNTGGMGTIAPVPWFTEGQMAAVGERIVAPILRAMREGKKPFAGLLYPGIKKSNDGLSVLEYNARFGDPETQVYMRLLKSDLLEIFEACVDGKLGEMNVEWNAGFAACIVLASGGYPAPVYKKGFPITGIEAAESLPGVVVFQAGTKHEAGQCVTSGGRVLGVTGVGVTLTEALERAYEGVSRIRFEGMQFRTDIGAKSLVPA